MKLNRLAVTFAALVCVSTAAIRVVADSAPTHPFDPNLGAIRASGSWRGTTFILVTGEGRGVALPALVDVPYGSDANTVPPPDYGPKGFWMEIDPGKYTLIAAAPDKRKAQVNFEVGKGQEIWLRADLEPQKSKFAVSEPLDQKTGPTWSKRDLIPVLQKLRWRQ